MYGAIDEGWCKLAGKWAGLVLCRGCVRGSHAKNKEQLGCAVGHAWEKASCWGLVCLLLACLGWPLGPSPDELGLALLGQISWLVVGARIIGP